MNYGTEDYSATRITPSRILNLPLTIVESGQDLATPPNIWNNLVYRVKPRQCVESHSEEDLSLKNRNESEEFVGGGFGFSDSFLLMTKQGEVCELSCSDSRTISKFDLGVIDSSQSFRNENYFILLKRDERRLGVPIKIGRKDSDKSEFSWEFQPVAALSGFALSQDEKYLVVSDYRGGIYLLDVNSGEVIWQHSVHSIGVLTKDELNYRELPGLSLHDCPRVYKNTIVLGYIFSYMIGLDLSTGELKWKRKFIGSSVSYTTLSSEGKVYYLAHTYTPTETVLYEIDCESGVSINEFKMTLEPHLLENFSSSVHSDVTDTHFWGVTSNGLLYAINLVSGCMDWHYDLNSKLFHVPFFICNNRLYITTSADQVVFEGAGGFICQNRS